MSLKLSRFLNMMSNVSSKGRAFFLRLPSSQDFHFHRKWLTRFIQFPDMVDAEAINRSGINSSGGKWVSQITDQTFVFGNGVMQPGMRCDRNYVSRQGLSGCDNIDNQPNLVAYLRQRL